MKRILILVFSVLVMVSCSNNDKSANNKDNKKRNKQEAAKVPSPNGDEVISSYTNGEPKIVRTFKVTDGKRVAVYEKEFYDDGKILKEGKLVNGKRDGLWKSFRRDGLLWSEGYFVNGNKQGTTTAYHPNGNVYYKGDYDNGRKIGEWTFYNNKGEQVKTEDFGK